MPILQGQCSRKQRRKATYGTITLASLIETPGRTIPQRIAQQAFFRRIEVLPPGLEPRIAESESAVISSLTTGAWLTGLAGETFDDRQTLPPWQGEISLGRPLARPRAGSRFAGGAGIRLPPPRPVPPPRALQRDPRRNRTCPASPPGRKCCRPRRFCARPASSVPPGPPEGSASVG